MSVNVPVCKCFLYLKSPTVCETAMDTSVKVARILLDAGCDISQSTNVGKTPVSLALEQVCDQAGRSERTLDFNEVEDNNGVEKYAYLFVFIYCLIACDMQTYFSFSYCCYCYGYV